MTTKKEQRIKKAAEKNQAKQERESIVNSYIEKIQEVIDQGYLEMTESLDIFNKELEQGTIKYGYVENQIRTLLKLEVLEDTKFDDLLNTISEMELKNNDLYQTITSRDLKTNKLLIHLPGIAEKVANVIQQANDKLLKNKNKIYIISMLTNRSMDVFKGYNRYIADIALESNEYIDMYIDARENFLDFVESSKKDLEQKIINYESYEQAEIIIEDNIKYNQRLRVEYTDLSEFLKHKGYSCERQGSTTHAVWKHIESGHSVPLPNKSGTIPQGTTSKVLKQIGSSRNELAQYLYA